MKENNINEMKTSRSIESLTDDELFNAAQILGGASHLSRESVIAQSKELLLSNRLYNGQTNIPGINWLRLAVYLQSIGIQLSNS